ncbi:MAG: right-handed parallel beta-helix repeat-containing protein [Candidatus Thorarchaeota archaeon]
MNRGLGFAIILLLFFVPLPRMHVVETENPSIFTERLFQISDLNTSEPIDINWDSDFFEHFGHTGNGTLNHPYIIENLFIDLNLTGGDGIYLDETWIAHAIEIKNTRSHFIIRDCVLQGRARWLNDPRYSTPPFDIMGTGIYLQNVANAIVYNNTVILTSQAIGGWDIYNSTFIGNTVYGNIVDGSPGDYSSDGFDIDENSSGNIIANNSCQKTAVGIRLSMAHHNIVENNTITASDDGISVFHLSTFNNVSFNNCSFNAYSGISLQTSMNNLIANNTCMWNDKAGINIPWECYNNTIIGNLVAFNGLEYSETEGQIAGEKILAQSYWGHGIWIESHESKEPNRLNNVLWNDIIRNGLNARNDEAENSYDYNFWSDYNGTDFDGDMIGDSHYIISGDSPTYDPHPRITTRYSELLSTDEVDQNGIQAIQIIVTLSIVGSSIALVIVFVRRRTKY